MALHLVLLGVLAFGAFVLYILGGLFLEWE